MKSEWQTARAADFMDFNPRLSIKKGTVATKISMDKLRPFTKAVPSVEQAEFSGGTKFANGDTIMARITPCLENGKTAFVDCLRENEIAFGSTEFIVLRAKPGVSDPQFVYYLATSPEFRNVAIKSMVGSSGRQRVQQPVLENLELTVPKLPEQEKIGHFLAELDDKIALNERVNDNLYDLVNTLYTKLFKDTDCEMTTVEDYVDCIYSGGTPATSNMAYWNGNLNWLSSGETRNRFVISTEKTITQLGADNSSTKSAQKYDIVIASAGQGFTRGQTSMLLLNTYINQSVIVLHAKKTVLPYLFWNLTNRYDDLRAISDSSSIRGSLTTKMLSKLKIPKVEDSLILKFSEYAWSIIPQIENNLIENKRLTDLRDSLLPKLMSGEIDVSDIQL
jgi:type I restriction enzyme S subunit